VAATNFVAPDVRATLVVLNVTGIPAAIDTLFRVTVPAYALTLVMLIVALPLCP
jgi:hypothetical protein